MEDAEDDGDASTVMADPNNDCEIASPLPGTVEEINCDENATLKKGDCMMIVVAMKMEVKVTAPFDLRIDSFAVEKGSKVEEGSLVATVTKL
jgi:pyruvate carboxylase